MLAESPPSAKRRFPRIERLGYLSDGETNALIEGGGIHWMCLPEVHGPSVFSGLLGGSGVFHVGPAGVNTPAAQRNIPDALAIETEWRTPEGGRLVVTDALVRTPKGARQTLVRHIRCTKGKVQVEAGLEPVFDYGREHADWKQFQFVDGLTEAVVRSFDGIDLRLATDLAIVAYDGGPITLGRLLKEGDDAYIALSWGDHKPPRTSTEAEHLVKETIDHWWDWLASGDIPDHPFGPSIARSALVLKGLCHLSGAIAAAGTTSLPEDPGGIRNWDYRFLWGRDGAMTAMALYRLGFREAADDLVRFISDLPERDVQIMYGLNGQTRLVEETLPHLPGYEGAGPVRIGNGAYDQVQNDIWGQLLELIYQTQRNQMTAKTWRLVVRLVDGASEAWGIPDHGIWEIRGVPRVFISSLLYLWVAFDRAGRLALSWGDTDRARKWAGIAQTIREEILAGVDERGVFTATPGNEALDASCLLIPILGFLPGDDWRVRATVHAVAEGLQHKGLLLRYDTTQFGDGLAGEEMAFAITAFWLAEDYVLIGEPELAEELYDRVVRYTGSLGLLAEEIDPDTGRQWGNTPQAFSHLGLINAALALIRAGV